MVLSFLADFLTKIHSGILFVFKKQKTGSSSVMFWTNRL